MPRRLAPAFGLIAMIGLIAGGTASAATRVVLGHSVRGRPIVARVLGDPHARRRILVVGVIHGDEAAGLAITGALLHTRAPRGVAVWDVPELNPDGVAAGTRQNAHGVDLNRNFPYLWAPNADPVYASGPRPQSEPETRVATALIKRVHPAVTVWYHQHMDLVDEAGGDRGVARRYAQLAHLRATCLTFLAGTATLWSNHRFPGTTAFVVELPAGPVGPVALGRHLRALRAIERGQRSGSAGRCDSVTTAA